MNLKKNDEVITTPLTFCATINSIINAGGKPVLADIDEKSLNIDTSKIIKAINKRTKAILVVHFAGRMANIKKISQICSKYKIKLIEDCAHAIETKLGNKSAGTFGNFGCYSFYVTKNITTNGEGGMLVAKNKNQLIKLRKLSLHGMSKNAWNRFGKNGYKSYDITNSGFKFNMTDIQAAAGIVQLKNIEKSWLARKKIWNIYKKEFKNLPFEIPTKISKNEKHSYHLFTIILKNNREKFINYMTKNKIGVGIHYNSIGSFKFYKNKVKNFNSVKIANKLCKNIVSIPVYESLTNKETKYIIKKINQYFV